MRTVYVDNAAGTPLAHTVRDAMQSALRVYGNPSSYNNAGREARELLDQSRNRVAQFLGVHATEIIFTASGSEANTLALLGAVGGSGRYSGSIVSTPIEHPSVLSSLSRLKQHGFAVKLLPVDREGIVRADALDRALTSKTLLVSVMYANNEIGSIQPIRALGKKIRAFRKEHGGMYPLFHVDACQAAEYLPVDVQSLGVDLLTMNGSKIYGPRGTGVLYVREGVPITPLILGGEQERGRRAGTENMAALVGFARAVEGIEREKEGKRVGLLRDMLIEGIATHIPDAHLNGPRGALRLPNNVHVSIPGITSETILIELDRVGIYAGSGSACTAHSVEPSHVLQAIETPKRYLDGALRISLGRATRRSDVVYIIRELTRAVERIRKRYAIR